MAKNKSGSGIDASTGEVERDVELDDKDALAAAMGFSVDKESDEEDFVSLTQEGELIYSVPEPGHTFRGLLLGRFLRPGRSMGNPHFYRIELTAPAIMYKGSKKKKEQTRFEAPIGTIINFDERAGVLVLKGEAEKVEAGARIEVLIRCGMKQDTSGGTSFWPYSVKSRTLG